MKINTKKTAFILFLIIIVFQVICGVELGRKTRLYGDEWFSYGLANNTDGYLFMTRGWVDIKSNETGWIKGDDIRQYLTVNKGEQLDCLHVIKNQRDDVHPPFYYALIHLMSSLTPEKLTPLIGRLINIIFLIGIHILFWKISGYICKNDITRWIPNLVLLISYANISLITYTRMYTLLCFLCLYTVYHHIRLHYEADSLTKKQYLILAISVFLGCLTHYYFYIFLFWEVVVFFITDIILRKPKCKYWLKYFATLACGGGGALIIFPWTIKHLFFSYRSEQIQEGILSNKAQTFTTYFNILNQYVFNNRFIIIMIVITLIIVMRVFRLVVQKEKKNYLYVWYLLGMMLLLYFVTISMISVETLWYYISPCMPILLLLIGGVISNFADKTKPLYQMPLILLVVLSIFGAGNIAELNNMNQKYENEKHIHKDYALFQNKDCIYVSKDWNNLFDNQLFEFMEMDNIYCISTDELHQIDLNEVLKQRLSTNEILLCITLKNNEEAEEQVDYIQNAINMRAEHIYSGNRVTYYYLKAR